MTAALAQRAGLPVRTRDNVAIIGFTQHNYEAPWGNPDWDFFGLNDLHQVFERYMPGCFKTDQAQWFQLHHKQADDQYPGARDPQHTKWLKEQTCPIWMWAHDPDIPASRPYPIRDILNLRHPRTGKLLCPERYFNNSISWMIALAIMHGYERIGLYGVDMAMDGVHGESEYGWQRPSVEAWIGIARGLGIDVTFPEVSELYKCGFLYGYDNVSPLRKKLTQRLQDLEAAEQRDVHAYEATKRLLFQTRGGLMVLTGNGISSPELLAAAQAIPDPVRQKAVAILEADEVQISNDHQSAESSMHEARGALNNLRWLLKNYLPGDGAVQDLPRTERSLTRAEVEDDEAAGLSDPQGIRAAGEAGSVAPGLPGPEAQKANPLRLEVGDRAHARARRQAGRGKPSQTAPPTEG